MRGISAQIETLGPTRFTLLIGLVAGAIQGLPRLLLGGASTVPPRLTPFLIIGATAVLWWTAALLLWWIAVRRRQSSLWMISAQVTLGLIIAELFAAVLGMVGASIATNGAFAAAIAHQPFTVLVSNLSLPLLGSPLWFVGSAVAIAMGRHLAGGPQAVSASTSASSHPGAVT